MFLRVILNNLWFQIVFLIGGPIVLWVLTKKERERKRPVKAATGGSTGNTHQGEQKQGNATLAPGFRGLRWGEPKTAEMAIYHEEGEDKFYTRAGDVLLLADAPVTSILYSYHNDRLQAVMIEMPNRSADAALAYLNKLWGASRQPKPPARKYYWTEILTGADAFQAVLEVSSVKMKTSLVISSKLMSAEREKEGAIAKTAAIPVPKAG